MKKVKKSKFVINYRLIFVVEILAFLFISFMSAAVEGSSGGLFGKNKLYGLSGDMYLFLFVVPLFLLIPIIVRGFDSLLIGTLMTGAFIGGIALDYCWIIINPNFGIHKLNSQYITWTPWLDLRFIEIPSFHIINVVWTVILWFIFIKNSKKVDNLYRRKILNRQKSI